jgi:mRNA interferase YafQ
MFEIVASTKFLKDLKLLKKRSAKDLLILQNLVTILAERGHEGLDKKHKPHKLSGNYKGYWECHVKPEPQVPVCKNFKTKRVKKGCPYYFSSNA